MWGRDANDFGLLLALPDPPRAQLLGTRLSRHSLPPASARPEDCVPPGTPLPLVAQAFAIWELLLFLSLNCQAYGSIHGPVDQDGRRHRFVSRASGELPGMQQGGAVSFGLLAVFRPGPLVTSVVCQLTQPVNIEHSVPDICSGFNLKENPAE